MGQFETGQANALTGPERDSLVAYIATTFSSTQTASVNFNGSTAVALQNIATNTTNPPSVITSITASAPVGGTVTQPGTSTSATYTHTGSDCTAVSFTFQGSGAGGALTSVRTVNLTVNPPAAPTAANSTANIAYSTGATPIPLSLGGGPATGISITTPLNPSVGMLNITGTSVTYTANPAVYAPSLTFSYRATGPCGTQSGIATVTINVGSPPAPTAAARARCRSPSTRIRTSISRPRYPEYRPALQSQAIPPTAASCRSRGMSSSTRPNAGYLGPDSFTYRALGQPAGNNSAPATVTINVIPPAPPTVANRAITVAFNTATPIDLAAQITGVFNTVAVASAPANGVASAAASGSVVTYTPNNGFIGADSFTYTATGPGNLTSNAATVNITVMVPAPPTAATRSVTVPFNTQTPIDLTAQVTGVVTSLGVVTAPANGSIVSVNGNVITYSPNAGFVGTDSFTYRATGPGGASAPATVSVTVAAPPAPTAASKSIATSVNTAIPIDLGASITGAFTSIAVAGAPANGTTAVAGNVVTYTPASRFSGLDSFTYTATGPGGTSAAATVNITVGQIVPVAGGAALTVPLNTPTTIDLAQFITGGAATGVAINSAPAHGTATVNGSRVTFTPTNNYFGPDTFTYVAINTAGTSAPGTVTVTVVGRPDPTKDAAVVGVLAAQADAALRFSRAHISNFQRRMESLHRRSGGEPDAARASNSRGERPTPGAPAATAAVTAAMRQAAETATDFSGQDPLRLAGAPAASSAPDSQGGGSAFSKLFPVATDAMSILTSRSVNLGSLTAKGAAAAAGAPQDTGGVGFWIDGNASFGTRDATGARSGLDFSTDGISFGADRRFGEQWVLGVGGGYARDKTDVGTDGSESKAQGYAAAFYGSYQPGRNFFVDGLIGAGTLDFETRRFVAPVSAYAQADRDGYQVFGSLAAGYEHHDKGLLLSPYGRLDYSRNRLDQVTESGAGQFALTYFKQNATSVQGALGLRAESAHATNFGWAAPRLRIELRHEFEGDRLAQLAYADLLAQRYAVSTGAISRNALAIGIGSDFVTRDGLTIGVDYQYLHSFGENASHAFRVRLSKELDRSGLDRGTACGCRAGRPPARHPGRCRLHVRRQRHPLPDARRHPFRPLLQRERRQSFHPPAHRAHARARRRIGRAASSSATTTGSPGCSRAPRATCSTAPPVSSPPPLSRCSDARLRKTTSPSCATATARRWASPGGSR